MTLAQRFQQKRAAILEDKFLSEAGKKAKLRVLFDEMQTEVAAERVRLAATEAGLKAKREEIMKQKPPQNKLPQLPLKAGETGYFSDYEKTQLALFAQIGGLLAEQRTAGRLVSAIAAAASPDAARQALERVLMLEPFGGSALISAYSEMLTAAESKFATRQARSQDGDPAMDSGDLIGLGQFRAFLDAKFKELLAADQSQKRFFEENAQAIDDISTATIANLQASVNLEATWDDVQNLSVDTRLASFTVED